MITYLLSLACMKTHFMMPCSGHLAGCESSYKELSDAGFVKAAGEAFVDTTWGGSPVFYYFRDVSPANATANQCLV